jgi:hypothetical protein
MRQIIKQVFAINCHEILIEIDLCKISTLTIKMTDKVFAMKIFQLNFSGNLIILRILSGAENFFENFMRQKCFLLFFFNSISRENLC